MLPNVRLDTGKLRLEMVAICRVCHEPAKLDDGSPLRALVGIDKEEPKLICPACCFGPVKSGSNPNRAFRL